MTGHESIISLRKQGKAPSYIFINDFPCKTDWEEYQDHATVCVYEESIKTLDLRFLVDMAVLVCSEDLDRAKALFTACKRHSPSTLICTHIKPNTHPLDQDGLGKFYVRK